MIMMAIQYNTYMNGHISHYFMALIILMMSSGGLLRDATTTNIIPKSNFFYCPLSLSLSLSPYNHRNSNKQ
jgi:hypothetical protein